MMRPENTLTIAYLEKHPADAARVLENLPYTMSARLLEQLPPEKCVGAFQFLLPSYAANLMDAFQDEYKGQFINTLSGDKLSILLSFYDEDKRKSFLKRLPAEKRSGVIRHMQYPLGTVGTVMIPPAFTLSDDITAAEALKRIKNSRRKYPAEIFILDRRMQYRGVVTLDKLIKSPSSTRLGSITDSSLQPVRTRKALAGIMYDPVWATSRILPVTDSRGIFAGLLEYSAVLQYRKSTMPRVESQQTVHLSVLELLFQTLAVMLEVLAKQLFPSKTPRNIKDTGYDNIL